jgi:hypothetical protein
MRRLILASAAVAALAAGVSLAGPSAEAMSLPGAAGAAKVEPMAEKVYVRCTRFWNGYRWVRRCVEVGPSYYAPPPPPPVYYAPRPYYYGPRPWAW